jgi:hypothetical protein
MPTIQLSPTDTNDYVSCPIFFSQFSFLPFSFPLPIIYSPPPRVRWPVFHPFKDWDKGTRRLFYYEWNEWKVLLYCRSPWMSIFCFLTQGTREYFFFKGTVTPIRFSQMWYWLISIWWRICDAGLSKSVYSKHQTLNSQLSIVSKGILYIYSAGNHTYRFTFLFDGS